MAARVAQVGNEGDLASEPPGGEGRAAHRTAHGPGICHVSGCPPRRSGGGR